jgi:hypothetical protein
MSCFYLFGATKEYKILNWEAIREVFFGWRLRFFLDIYDVLIFLEIVIENYHLQKHYIIYNWIFF